MIVADYLRSMESYEAWKSIVEIACSVASLSPCQSKRGVVLWQSIGIIYTGFNDQPTPFSCDGSDRCKEKCGKTAVHAEQRAILNAGQMCGGASMLHVKAKSGKPCASMAPSCLECSKLILASGILSMHLLHDPEAQMLPGAKVVGSVDGFCSDGNFGELQIRQYSAVDFHRLTVENWHGIKLARIPMEGK